MIQYIVSLRRGLLVPFVNKETFVQTKIRIFPNIILILILNLVISSFAKYQNLVFLIKRSSRSNDKTNRVLLMVFQKIRFDLFSRNIIKIISGL